MNSQTNRRVVVTGGATGIGFAIAKGFVDTGCNVLIAGRSQEKLDHARQKLGSSAKVLSTDLRKSDAGEYLVKHAGETMGGIDVLVNNAGMNIRKNPEDYTPEEWDDIIRTNLTSGFICSNAALPLLRSSGGGKIINIGSMLSIFGLPFAAPYAASKGGVVQLTKSCAVAWAQYNIQVNAILPGWIDTEITRAGRKQVEGLHEKIVERTPVRRWGDPADVAGAALFLASSNADFITGAAIPVDGGYSAMG